MNRKRILFFFLFVLACCIGLTEKTAAEDNETFLLNSDFDYVWFGMDSTSLYAKPVKQLFTTEHGFTVMVDKVLVTEDEITISFLIAGDFPEYVADAQVFVDHLEVGPLLPYPPDNSFEIFQGGGGGGGPILNIIHEKPTVTTDVISTNLLKYEGYVSPSATMHVKFRISLLQIGWEYEDENGLLQWEWFAEECDATFEFDTDGKELAALTKTIPVDFAFESDGHEYEFHELRFNPMQLILFTGKMNYSVQYISDFYYAQAQTDDGTRIILYYQPTPYSAYKAKILDHDEIASLEATKTLTLSAWKARMTDFEFYEMYHEDFLPGDDRAFDCPPERSVTVKIRE